MTDTTRTITLDHETGPPLALPQTGEHPVLRLSRRVSVSRHIQPALLTMHGWVSFQLTDPALLLSSAQRAVMAVYKDGKRRGIDVLALPDDEFAESLIQHFNFTVSAAVIAQAIRTGRRDEIFQAPLLHSIARQHFDVAQSTGQALDSVFVQWARSQDQLRTTSIYDRNPFQVALGEAMHLAEDVVETALLPLLASAERLIRRFQFTLSQVPQSGALSTIQEQYRKLGRHAADAYFRKLGEGGEAWIGSLDTEALRAPPGALDLLSSARHLSLQYVAAIERELNAKARSLFDMLVSSQDSGTAPAAQNIPVAQQHRLMSEINRATVKVLDRMTPGEQDCLIDALGEFMPPVAEHLLATLVKRRRKHGATSRDSNGCRS